MWLSKKGWATTGADPGFQKKGGGGGGGGGFCPCKTVCKKKYFGQ